MSQKSVEDLIVELSIDSRVAIIYNPHLNSNSILGGTFEEYVTSTHKTMGVQKNKKYFMTEEEAKKVKETNVMWEIYHIPRDISIVTFTQYSTIAATLHVALDHALNGLDSNNIFAIKLVED